MKVMYISSMFENKDIDDIFDDAGKVPYAANKFNSLLCKGIAQNGIDVCALSILPITRANCKKIFVKGRKKHKENLQWCYLPTINIPIIKNIFRLINVFFKVLFAPKGTNIFFDVFAISANLGMIIAAKIRGFERICIVTDLPEILVSRKLSLKFHNFVVKNSTGYILLTKQMSEKINPQHKKEAFVEGVADFSLSKNKCDNEEQDSVRKVMYAGSLHKMYGIDNLVSAFLVCRKENEELHLYGDGDYVEEIKRISQKEPSVVYHGSCSNDKILTAERHATLLVNPRTSEGEYTKYSFPSKVLEYMSSGTPVLMAKLPGILDEYYNYCYVFDDSEPNGLAYSLRKVLDMDIDELESTGRKALDFVLDKKNNVIQAKKALDTLKIV